MDSRYHGKSIKSGPLTLDRIAQMMDVANELWDLEHMMSLALVMVRISHLHLQEKI